MAFDVLPESIFAPYYLLKLSQAMSTKPDSSCASTETISDRSCVHTTTVISERRCAVPDHYLSDRFLYHSLKQCGRSTVVSIQVVSLRTQAEILNKNFDHFKYIVCGST